ncbi:MAG: peptidoglycan-binding protein [Burkholderiaceae bacterium]|nr:MAG: peptidoglycan-binding protein [Burkholderiaceae bacterium]
MEGAKAALNNYSDSDVDRFNAMVADYNSRCGSFRYRSGALESARRDVEPYRGQLQVEGRSRFVRSPSTGSLSAPAPAPARPAPDATVQAIQRKLNELGYDAGSADGLMGTKTSSAILAFQRDSGLSPDGRASADLLAKLNSAATSIATSNRSKPSRSELSFPNVGSPAPVALPSQNTQSSSSTRDAENFRTCISGDYPSLCKHNLLTPNEAAQVAAAERRANFQTCISGDYPSLCKHHLLTSNEATQVAAAERRANFQTCISGDYPSLCKHNLLTPSEATQVAAAERRANFQTCISGDYPSLCKHSLLNAEEAARVAEAERRARSR